MPPAAAVVADRLTALLSDRPRCTVLCLPSTVSSAGPLLLLQAPVEKVKALIEHDCVEPVFGLYVVSTRTSVPDVSVPPCLYF